MDGIIESTNLMNLLANEIKWYDTKGLGATSFYTENLQKKVFAVLDVPDNSQMIDEFNEFNYSADVIIMAHIVEDYIIIDADKTDRPLFESLLDAGIAREKIILGYMGEKLPTSATNPK